MQFVLYGWPSSAPAVRSCSRRCCLLDFTCRLPGAIFIDACSITITSSSDPSGTGDQRNPLQPRIGEFSGLRGERDISDRDTRDVNGIYEERMQRSREQCLAAVFSEDPTHQCWTNLFRPEARSASSGSNRPPDALFPAILRDRNRHAWRGFLESASPWV